MSELFPEPTEGSSKATLIEQTKELMSQIDRQIESLHEDRYRLVCFLRTLEGI